MFVFKRRPLPERPRSVLMMKAHSAGIGDILRSSAAWSALKSKWPDVQLHLVFFTRWPGASSEELIAQHNLLSTVHFIPIFETHFLGMRGVGLQCWRELLPSFRRVIEITQPDLGIDHEMFGFETILLAHFFRKWTAAPILGVREVPGRGLFYDYSGPGMRQYSRLHSLSMPLEYTHRDFCALSPLGIKRGNTAVKLNISNSALPYLRKLKQKEKINEETVLIGINIGCGTPDAIARRPSTEIYCKFVIYLFEKIPSVKIIFTGAPDERVINEQLISDLKQNGISDEQLVNLGGETTVVELAAVINSCHVFISGDSGPYHMAVALKVPTVAIFNWENSVAYHSEDWVSILVRPDPMQVLDAVMAKLPVPQAITTLNL